MLLSVLCKAAGFLGELCAPYLARRFIELQIHQLSSSLSSFTNDLFVRLSSRELFDQS